MAVELQAVQALWCVFGAYPALQYEQYGAPAAATDRGGHGMHWVPEELGADPASHTTEVASEIGATRHSMTRPHNTK